MVAILRKLPSYRWDSRFTTWAYKFALLEAAVRVRRRAWQDREIPLEEEGLARLAAARGAPDLDAETAELLAAIAAGIGQLTQRQRTVLVAITLDGVPIDVLAERMAVTRGALYRVVAEMVVAWVITIPSTVVIGWAMFQLTALPGAAAFVAVGAVLFVLFGWIAWAMSKALRASDVAAEIPSEDQLREPVGAVPHIASQAPLE